MLPQGTWASSISVSNGTLTVNSDQPGWLAQQEKTAAMKACTKIVLIGKFNESDLQSIQAANGTDFQATEVDMAEAKFVRTNSGGSVPSSGNYYLFSSAASGSYNNGDRAIVGGTLYQSVQGMQWTEINYTPSEGTTVATISSTSDTNGHSAGEYGKIFKEYKYVQMQITEGSWSGPFNNGNNFSEPSGAQELTLTGSETGNTNAEKEESYLANVLNDYSTNQYVYFNRYYKCVQENGNWYWRPATQQEYNAGSNQIDGNLYGINLNNLESGNDTQAAGDGNTMILRVYYQKQGGSRSWTNEITTAPENYTIVDGDFAYRNNHTENYEDEEWVRLIDYDYYQLQSGSWQWEQVAYNDGDNRYINVKYASENERTSDTNMPNQANQYAIVMGTELVYNGSSWEDPANVTELPNYGDMKFSYWSSTLKTAVTSKYADENIANEIFQNCKSLTYVDFKGGIVKDFKEWKTSNGYTANSMTVNVGQNVTKIAESAFKECDALKAITFDAGNGTEDAIPGRTYPLDLVIDNDAFLQSYYLAEVEIPNRVSKIGNAAFKWAGNSTEEFVVTFQRRYTDDTKTTPIDGYNGTTLTLGADAFAFCEKLKHVSMPIRMTSMGNNTFQNSGLETFEIREDIEDAMIDTIPAGAFLACKLQDINIPRSVIYIKAGAFSNTPTIKTIRFQEQIVAEGQQQEPLYIESGAFSGGNEQDQILRDVYVDFLPTDRLLICEYNAFSFTSMEGQTYEGSLQFATLHFPKDAWDFYQGNWKRGLAFRQDHLNAFKDGYNGKYGGIESENNCTGMASGAINTNGVNGVAGKYGDGNKYIAPANGWQQFAMTSTDIDIKIPEGSFIRSYSSNSAYVIPRFAEQKLPYHEQNDPMFKIYRITKFDDGYDSTDPNADPTNAQQAQGSSRVAYATEVLEYDFHKETVNNVEVSAPRTYIPEKTGLLMVGLVEDDYVVYFADADFTGGTQKTYPFNVHEYIKGSENVADTITNFLYPSCIDNMRMNGVWTNGVCGLTPQLAGEPTIGDYNGVSKILLYSTIPYPYYNVSDVRFRLFGYYSTPNKFKRVEGAKITRDKAYLKLPASLFHWTCEYSEDENTNGSGSGVTKPATPASAHPISLVFGEDDESQATGIQQIDQTLRQIDSDSYYTLQGAKLNGRPTQRGIYIHNGKKVIVK